MHQPEKYQTEGKKKHDPNPEPELQHNQGRLVIRLYCGYSLTAIPFSELFFAQLQPDCILSICTKDLKQTDSRCFCMS